MAAYVRQEYLGPDDIRRLRHYYAAGLASGRLTPRVEGPNKSIVDFRAVTNDPRLVGLPARVAATLRGCWPGLPPLALDLAVYSRMGPGAEHQRHADGVLLPGDPRAAHHTGQRLATGIVYLSAEGHDFAGGALLLDEPPRAEAADGRPLPATRTVDPEPGLFVGFLRDEPHAVAPVTSGARDALVFWYKAAPGPAAEPAAPPRRPAGVALHDPHAFYANGCEKIVEAIEELAAAQGLRPTAAQADRLVALAGRLAAVAKSPGVTGT